ncbi:hypothetical protein JCM17478_19380 [Thermopirellula anaerolimosa]
MELTSNAPDSPVSVSLIENGILPGARSVIASCGDSAAKVAAEGTKGSSKPIALEKMPIIRVRSEPIPANRVVVLMVAFSRFEYE